MTMPLASTTLPQNTGSGYVAAAYIVFVAIVLIYVSIMAVRLSRMERDLRELRTRAAESTTTSVAEQLHPVTSRPQPPAQAHATGRLPGDDDEARDQARERETV
jgi:hypothetical protein